MTLLNEKVVSCPYCGESIDVLIDSEEVDQQYIEDCQVCCRPITFVITTSFRGDMSVAVHAENETF